MGWWIRTVGMVWILGGCDMAPFDLQFPLVVYADRSDWTSAEMDQVSAGVAIWNESVGPIVAVVDSDEGMEPTCNTVRLQLSEMAQATSGRRKRGWVESHWISDGTGGWCAWLLVDVDSTLIRTGRRLPIVVAHELGHVFGLPHDEDDRGSIMYPGSRPDQVVRSDHVSYLRSIAGL